MTDSEKELLIRIDERTKDILEALARDYKALHGNGSPGLLARVQKLEDMHQTENTTLRKYGAFIAWLVTTALALYSAIKHH